MNEPDNTAHFRWLLEAMYRKTPNTTDADVKFATNAVELLLKSGWSADAQKTVIESLKIYQEAKEGALTNALKKLQSKPPKS